MGQLNDLFWIPRPLLNGTALGVPADVGPTYGISPDDGGDAQFRGSHFIECVNIEEARNYSVEWSDLASRSLESNVFLEPSFALAAARHVADAGCPQFLLVWESGAVEARGRLISVWPLVFPRTVFGATVKAWAHDFSCCSSPLLDKTQPFYGLELMFKWLRDRHPHVHALVAPAVRTGGPLFRLLRKQAENNELSLSVLGQFERAALKTNVVGLNASDFVSLKKKKELQRQFRRLRDLGAVTFGVAREGADLRDQVEAFMVLEAKGWKGRQGGAFLNDPGLATFLRAMTRGMGNEGKCRLYFLSLNGRMIAGNIVLLSRETAYFWKTAYDEEFSFASPGVLLTMDMTDRLLREPRIVSADSCAIPGHPMIDHIWRERLRVADVMVSLRGESVKAFNGALQREQFRRRLRDKAKSALERFRSA